MRRMAGGRWRRAYGAGLVSDGEGVGRGSELASPKSFPYRGRGQHILSESGRERGRERESERARERARERERERDDRGPTRSAKDNNIKMYSIVIGDLHTLWTTLPLLQITLVYSLVKASHTIYLIALPKTLKENKLFKLTWGLFPNRYVVMLNMGLGLDWKIKNRYQFSKTNVIE